MRVRKGLEVAWGQRKRGEPTGFDDIDSDEETVMSLSEQAERDQAKELRSRRKVSPDSTESRFVVIKEGESLFGGHGIGHQPDLTYAYGVFGNRS